MEIAAMKDIHYRQGNRILLKNIDWTINRGEHWIVLGNNGSGKTTLTSILAGYHGYSEGELRLFNQTATENNIERLRKKIGFISESYFSRCLFKENGINIVLGGGCGQLCEDESVSDAEVQRAKQLLKAFGLKNRGMYPYDMLSKGQQQKVLLCRAFMRKAELLILDEPCTGLDLLSREFLLNTLQQISNDKNVSIVCVTHHLDEIMAFYTHVLLLKDSEIFMQGKITEIITKENMTKFFDKPTTVQWDGQNIRIRIEEKLALPETLWKY